MENLRAGINNNAGRLCGQWNGSVNYESFVDAKAGDYSNQEWIADGY